MANRSLAVILVAVVLASCRTGVEKLPILGDTVYEDGDTIYHTISPFTYVNQDSIVISDEILSGKAYVADFFFTSCPTICPKVKQQLIRLDNRFGEDERLHILSMSIDYRKDSVPILKRYYDKLGLKNDRWHLVQLTKDQVEPVANEYFNIAFEDKSAPGGFDHSGRLILIDGQGHIRAFCDGTDPDSVDKFMDDIDVLLNEM